MSDIVSDYIEVFQDVELKIEEQQTRRETAEKPILDLLQKHIKFLSEKFAFGEAWHLSIEIERNHSSSEKQIYVRAKENYYREPDIECFFLSFDFVRNIEEEERKFNLAKVERQEELLKKKAEKDLAELARLKALYEKP